MRAVLDGLMTIHRLFYPDEVLLAGPLVENPAVFRRLVDGFAAGLPDYAVGKTTLAVLPGGLSACRTAAPARCSGTPCEPDDGTMRRTT